MEEVRPAASSDQGKGTGSRSSIMEPKVEPKEEFIRDPEEPKTESGKQPLKIEPKSESEEEEDTQLDFEEKETPDRSSMIESKAEPEEEFISDLLEPKGESGKRLLKVEPKSESEEEQETQSDCEDRVTQNVHNEQKLEPKQEFFHDQENEQMVKWKEKLLKGEPVPEMEEEDAEQDSKSFLETLQDRKTWGLSQKMEPQEECKKEFINDSENDPLRELFKGEPRFKQDEDDTYRESKAAPVPDLAEGDIRMNNKEDDAVATMREQEKCKDVSTDRKGGSFKKSAEMSFVSNVYASSSAQEHVSVVQECNSTDEDPFQCSYCDSTFTQIAAKNCHESFHHFGKRLYACDRCNIKFASAWTLANHKVVHSEDRPFVCPTCGAAFKKEVGLKRHSKIHNSSQHYECNVCQKEFNTKHRRDIHEKSHDGAQSSKNSAGETSFSSERAPQQRKITNLNSFTCDTCQKTFAKKPHLIQHITSHMENCSETGEKSAAGKPNRSLRKWRRSRKKEYKCKKCSDTFPLRRDFILHKKTHQKEKPFECKLCHRRYHFQKNLEKHIPKHMNEMSVTCKVCGDGFISIRARKRHQKKQHPKTKRQRKKRQQQECTSLCFSVHFHDHSRINDC